MNYKEQKLVIRNGIISMLFMALLLLVLSPLTNYLDGNISNAIVLECISYAFINTLRLFYTTQFVLACNLIQKRFQTLNEILKTSVRSSSSKSRTTVSEKCSKTSKYCKVFHDLCDGIENINSTFTFHFIFLLTTILVREHKNFFLGVLLINGVFIY